MSGLVVVGTDCVDNMSRYTENRSCSKARLVSSVIAPFVDVLGKPYFDGMEGPGLVTTTTIELVTETVSGKIFWADDEMKFQSR